MMKRFGPIFLVVLFAIAVAAIEPVPAPGGYPAPRGYVATATAKAPTIDGRLDDDAWKDVPWSEDFADIEGDRKPKPRHRTRMKMTWDDTALYIAAELDEPNVWATIDQHDAVIFQDPDFEVFLDPDGDSHLYAELELNAKNTTWDLLLPKPYKNGGQAINAWEITGLKTAVAVKGTLNDPKDIDTGWTIEIAWPWKGLKELAKVPMPPRNFDRWRINFSRVQWDVNIVNNVTEKVKGKREHNWVWSPQGVIDMHRPERWGFVQFRTAGHVVQGYRADPLQADWDLLHTIYYAQKDYYDQKKTYATLEQLKKTGTKGVSIRLTDSGYELTLDRDGKRLSLRDDALKQTRDISK